MNNLDYEYTSSQAHPYANGFYNGFDSALINGMKADHMGSEFDKASQHPDQYTGTPPLAAARAGFKELDNLNREFNRQYQQNRFHYTEPTAESIHQSIEKYQNFPGGLAGTSLLLAAKRNLMQSGMTLAASNWSRLTP